MVNSECGRKLLPPWGGPELLLGTGAGSLGTVGAIRAVPFFGGSVWFWFKLCIDFYKLCGT